MSDAPGTGGASFLSVDRAALSGGGIVAFTALLSDGRRGLFRLDDRGITKVALTGEPAPDTGGSFGSEPAGSFAVNDSGTVAFASSIAGNGSGKVIWDFLFADDRLSNIRSQPGEVRINNLGDVVLSSADGIRVLSNGDTRTLVARGDPVPGTAGEVFAWFSATGINDSGEVAFTAGTEDGRRGIFLHSGGSLHGVAVSGDPAPGTNRTFGEFVDVRGPTALGKVVFAGRDRWTFPGGPPPPFGIFVYDGGSLAPLVIQNQEILGLRVFNLGGPAAAPSELVTFSSRLAMVFLYRAGRFAPMVLPHDHGILTNLARIDDSGRVLARNYPEPRLLLATPASRIPADGFEAPGAGGLPAGWSTWWTNGGTGDAFRYEAGPEWSFSGTSVLRLHVGPGGGSTFVLSDPIAPAPEGGVGVSVHMRYNLEGASDFAVFTLLQYDASGREVATDEVFVRPGENRWDWRRKGLFVWTHAEAASVRLRVGLSAATESHLDVDDVR